MKNILRKSTGAFLILAILLTLLPPMTVLGAGSSITVKNLYTNASQPNSNTQNLTRLTTSPMSIIADITGISDSQIQDIYYEITNVDTNLPTSTNKLNKAVKTGSSEITFSNVPLTPGLNKVVVRLGDTSGISSLAGWVTFNPITNITNVNINGAPFVSGTASAPVFYPSNPKSSTKMSITGKAYNTTQMEVQVAGNPAAMPVYANPSGDFSFSVDSTKKRSTSLANVFLNAGDNSMTILAKNTGNVSRVERSFVYDDGTSFAYNASILQSNGATPTPAYGSKQALISQPTVQTNGVKIETDIKVNLTVSGSTYKPQYPYVQLSVGSNVLPNTGQYYDLSGYYFDGSTMIKDPNDGVPLPLDGTKITYDSMKSKNSEYFVFHFESKGITLGATKKQLVKFQFNDSLLSAPSTTDPSTTHYFDYVDTTEPYVYRVSRSIDGTTDPGIALSELNSNEINEQPFYLRILSDITNTKGMDVQLGGNSIPAANITRLDPVTEQAKYLAGEDYTKYIVYVAKVSGLISGTNTLKAVPKDAGGNYDAGSKSYDLMVSTSPYIIIDGLYNGAVLNKNSGIGATGKIGGKVVNVSPLEQAAIQVSVNESVPKLLESSVNIDDDKGTFSNFSIAPLLEGRNVLKFFFYQKDASNNYVLVSQSTIEFYYFAHEAPSFGSVAPVPVVTSSRELFIQGKDPDHYSTTEREVKLKGNFVVDSGSNPQLTLTVRSKDKDGTPVSNSSSINLSTLGVTNPVSSATEIGVPPYFGALSVTAPSGGEINWSFITSDPSGITDSNMGIRLNPKGDTIFEFELANDSNIKVVKTITITREPVPYQILDLDIIKNDKGEDQANINSNFKELHIAAEFADKVLFGKDEAKKVIDTVTNREYYVYEVSNLKAGKNAVKFTVVRGTQKTNGSIVLFNVDTPVEGASYKAKMGATMKVFDGQVQLSFPKGTNLMRNEVTADNQYLTGERSILFGIANSNDGRVDKGYTTSDTDAKVYLAAPLRFRKASSLYWIDTGTIPFGETDMEKALRGSGRLPYCNPCRDGTQDLFYQRNPQDQTVPTDRGKLTLKYDPSIRDNAWRYVTVLHFDFAEDPNGLVGPGWRNIGGVIDEKNNTITVPFESPGYYQVMYMAKSFQDITNHSWARNDLDTLYAKGLMLNKDASAFQPNDFITRGEFTTLLVKIFDLALNYGGTLSFDDVGLNKSMDPLADYKYIETAARAGIVRGITETQFMPNISVSRQDAAVMIARAAELKLNNDPAKSLTALQKLYTDGNGIDIYARGAVEAVSKIGFIQGKDNVLTSGQKKTTLRFDPLETFTRAEAAAVAIRVLVYNKKIPK